MQRTSPRGRFPGARAKELQMEGWSFISAPFGGKYFNTTIRTEKECVSGTFVAHKVAGEYATEEEAAKAYDSCKHLQDGYNKRNMDHQPELYCEAL